MIPDWSISHMVTDWPNWNCGHSEDRRIRAELIEVYKMVHGLSSVQLETFFEADHGSRTGGNDCKLKKKRSNTRHPLHFLSERVINWWNSLENWKIQQFLQHRSTVLNFTCRGCGSKMNLCSSDRLVTVQRMDQNKFVLGLCSINTGGQSGVVRPHQVSI